MRAGRDQQAPMLASPDASMIDHPLDRGRSGSAPVLVLAGHVALSALVRALLAREIPVPFIFGDELLHGVRACSLREHADYLGRGRRVTISFLCPLGVASAWVAPTTESAYGAM